MSINWQQFGLQANPYDILPLVEGGALAIDDAFIGRDQERKIINNLLESEDRMCLTICGSSGVGKTSLANMQKFVWKYKHQGKRLFSFRREIEASDTLLDKHNFILEIISSILREIYLLEPALLADSMLQKLHKLVDISQMINISGGFSVNVAGVGGSVAYNNNPGTYLPPMISVSALEQHFVDLLDFIKTHSIADQMYAGLIVHVNNFDVVLQKPSNVDRVITFFNELRDCMQIKDTYYLFLGPDDFYSTIIAKQQRVKSIFVRTPLLIKPLSKTEVVKALHKRMTLLLSPEVTQYIKPIDDEVIFRLYDLYNGDIRSIMASVKDIISQCNDRLLQSLSLNEAMILLSRERWEHVASQLTPETISVLKFLIEKNMFVSVKEISESLGKAQSNVSGYYLPPLKEYGIVEEKERKGKTVYYGLTLEYEPLQWWLESEKNLKLTVSQAQQSQPTLFD